MDENTLKWLLEGPEWLEFAVRKNLLGEKPDMNLAARHPNMQKIITAVKNPDIGFDAIKNGKISYKKELFWYMYFLADIGFSSKELGLDEYFDTVLSTEDENHNFMLSKEMKPEFYCISSVLLSSMVQMSAIARKKLIPHIKTIIGAMRLDGGWHCAKSRDRGQKLEQSDSCPMDNMNVLRLLGQYDEYKNDSRLNGAIDYLFNHWTRRKEPFRPYGFGIGTQFEKLKYPAIIYGILPVLSALSLFPYARKKAQYNEMLDVVKSKMTDGKYTPESIIKMFEGFDFAQKKHPSRWLTYIINRIDMRGMQVV